MSNEWSKADADGVYWWRYDKSHTPEIIEVCGGLFYSIADPDPTSTTVGEFLGPITPEQLASAIRALEAFEQYKERHIVPAYFYAALADLRKALIGGDRQ
jgi:hypothetical protein